MPKKPNHQAESNAGAMSREDRKNEAICRMIERAEKQRQKKEEKKKLAVLNKATGKPGGIPRKAKKMGLLSPKRTQVAIHIMFSDKVRAHTASNRYFFERKQAIEEKQRMEQEEMWARYVFRIQQAQFAQQNAQAAATFQQSLFQHESVAFSNGAPGAVFNASDASNTADGVCASRPHMQHQQNQHIAAGASRLEASAASPLVGVNPLLGAQQATRIATQQRFYLNAGETGGNYEAGNEEHSGSSSSSSESKRVSAQQAQPAAATTSQQMEPTSATLQQQHEQPTAATLLKAGSHNTVMKQQSMMSMGPNDQQSLGSVINNLAQNQSTNNLLKSIEESKKASDCGNGVNIKVDLNGVKQAPNGGDSAQQAERQRGGTDSVAQPSSSEPTVEQKILAATRQLMLQQQQKSK